MGRSSKQSNRRFSWPVLTGPWIRVKKNRRRSGGEKGHGPPCTHLCESQWKSLKKSEKGRKIPATWLEKSNHSTNGLSSMRSERKSRTQGLEKTNRLFRRSEKGDWKREGTDMREGTCERPSVRFPPYLH